MNKMKENIIYEDMNMEITLEVYVILNIQKFLFDLNTDYFGHYHIYHFNVVLPYMGMVASIMIINFHFLGSER